MSLIAFAEVAKKTGDAFRIASEASTTSPSTSPPNQRYDCETGGGLRSALSVSNLARELQDLSADLARLVGPFEISASA